MNKVLEIDLLTHENVIQSQTPMKMIYHDLVKKNVINQDQIAVIGGSEKVHTIADEYGFKHYLTIQEMCALFPYLVPLTRRAGYPPNP